MSEGKCNICESTNDVIGLCISHIEGQGFHGNICAECREKFLDKDTLAFVNKVILKKAKKEESEK